MASTDIRLYRQNVAVASVANQQLTVEPTSDSDLGFKMWAGKDADGATYKFLGKDKPAKVTTLTTTDDIDTASDKAFYFGGKTTDGSWRITRDGDNLVFQRRESSSWVTKNTLIP